MAIICFTACGMVTAMKLAVSLRPEGIGGAEQRVFGNGSGRENQGDSCFLLVVTTFSSELIILKNADEAL